MNGERLVEGFVTACHFIGYLLRSKHRYGHGVHSPFAYEFISKVLFDRAIYPEYKVLQTLRNELKKSPEKLPVQDIGSVSVHFMKEYRKVSSLTCISSVNQKYSELLFKISRFYKPATIVELGTSIGLSALYLAKGSPESKVITVEGNQSLSQFASGLFRKCQVDNIIQIDGLFDDQLEKLKRDYSMPELVFVDGNHSYEPTLRYFEYFSSQMKTGILIFDDINWSHEMRKAWKEIKRNRKARVTFDLFYMGIVILNDSISPGHYRVRL